MISFRPKLSAFALFTTAPRHGDNWTLTVKPHMSDNFLVLSRDCAARRPGNQIEQSFRDQFGINKYTGPQKNYLARSGSSRAPLIT
jgi:hypothetical protein